MKAIITIILILNGLYIAFAQNETIRGKIICEVKAEYEFIRENVNVLICTDCEEFSVELDENLSFEFRDLKPGSFEIWIEPHTRYSYDFQAGVLEPNENLYLEIPVAFSCKYDQSENDKTCPICKKQNRVIPTNYGLLDYQPLDSYSLGCIKSDCDPNWYCKRDKIEF